MMDAQEASDLIGIVYESAFEKRQWNSLIKRLFALCPGHVPAATSFDDTEWVYTGSAALPDGRHGEEIRAVTDELNARGLDQPTDLHQAMVQRVDFSIGNVISTRDAFTDAELHGFEAYKKTMAPLGAGHWTAILYSIADRRRAAIMIVENDRDPQPKDHAHVRRICTLLAPHVVRAARIARALTLAREASETYRGFIDAIALPLVICDGDGAVQMANTAGQRLLDRRTLIVQDDRGRLRVLDAVDDTELMQVLRVARAEGVPQGMRLATETGTVSLAAAPFRPSMALGTEIDRRLYGQQNLVAIFLGAQDQDPVHADLLMDVFDLTPREAEICGALMAGQTPAQIAAQSRRSEKTVRNQVQAIHEKVGVSSARQLTEALSVFRTVGAMIGADGPGQGTGRPPG